MIPRFVHRLYAHALGYFWQPCPICGNHFGGHEYVSGGSVIYSQGEAWTAAHTICHRPMCHYYAGILNVTNGYRVYVPELIGKESA